MKIVRSTDKQKKVHTKSSLIGTIGAAFGLGFAFLVSLGLVSNVASPDKYTSNEIIEQKFAVVESEGGTYYGPLHGLVYTGSGEFEFVNIGIYEGEFSDSMRSGQGTFLWENGDSFAGKWENDEMLEGTFCYSDGTTYSGTFERNYFKDGYIIGQLTYSDGSVYEGEITGAQRGGKGTITWANGDSFSGTWSADHMESGTYTFVDGRTYIGTFNNDLFYTGNYYLNDLAKEKGYDSFSAEYLNGKLSGFDFKTNKGVSYKGDINGTAEITYSSGNTYSGDVKNGIRDGEGKFSWVSNGAVTASYSGKWSNGEMNGSGDYYFSSSSYPYIHGTFKNGKPDGTATYYKAAGNTFSTTWANGKCSKVTET